jgi:hypothetical protein
VGSRHDHDCRLRRLLPSDAGRLAHGHGRNVLRVGIIGSLASILASVLVPTPKAPDPSSDGQAALTDIQRSLTEIHRELAAIQRDGTEGPSAGTQQPGVCDRVEPLNV